MNNALALWPQAASASAGETDHIILAFTIVTLLLTVPIFLSITYYALRYRAGRSADRRTSENRSVLIEMSWMLIPFALTLIFFAWAVRLFDEHRHPPPGAMVVNAVARQWMWKFQHEGGQAEINDLHLPIGQAVIIRMISQDVIHGLYIPALRIQMETLPGRYTEIWFKATKTGRFHVLCSEYCGTDHSVMGGTLTLMQPGAYQDWLAHMTSPGSMAEQGRALFASYGCVQCHGGASTVRAPSLAGLYDRPVPMRGGGVKVADDGYLRGKILTPDRDLIAGYEQKMPGYQGVLGEDDLMRIIAYIKAGAETRAGGSPS
jgi:cytochrome c oxidase subunit 2